MSHPGETKGVSVGDLHLKEEFDTAKERNINKENKVTTSIHQARLTSPVDSERSLDSNWSMEQHPESAEELTQSASICCERPSSPVDSMISYRSDQSMMEPLTFTGEFKQSTSVYAAGLGFISCSLCRWLACKTCLTCSASYCESHVRQHYKAPALQRHKLVEATADMAENKNPQMMECGLTAQKGGARRKSLDCIIDMSTHISKGPPERYLLKTEKQVVDKDENVKRWTFGKKDNKKKNCTILLVGETRTGKTTLINSLINYIIGVKKEDNVWFEISMVNEEDQTICKTNAITLYEIFSETSPISWSIIDTPGYGDTRGIEYDEKIAKSLLTLVKSYDGISCIDAIGLVVTASQNCLHDRQIYIFDEIQALLSIDVKDNIVVFITHAEDRSHRNVFKAIEDARVPVAKTDNEPVHFLFDNFQSDRQLASDKVYSAKWEMGQKSTEKVTEFLMNVRRQNLKMTLDVLRDRIQLETDVNMLQKCNEEIADKQKALSNTMCEFERPTTEMVKIRESTWSANKATYCKQCKVNCHYPGCWWVSNLKWCSVMKQNKCTVCPGKCSYVEHDKGNQKYVEQKKKIQMTYEQFKQYEREHGKQVEVTYLSDITNLQAQLKEEKANEEKLLDKIYMNIIELDEIALKSGTLSTLVHLDFVIERMKGTGNTERVHILENLKKKYFCPQNQGALRYLRKDSKRKKGKK